MSQGLMIIPRDVAARELSVSTRWLARYESAGLVKVVREGDVEGYGPAEVRRLWTIVTCQRDLGINLAGVEAILKLRDHMAEVHLRLEGVADQLRQFLEEEDVGNPDG